MKAFYFDSQEISVILECLVAAEHSLSRVPFESSQNADLTKTLDGIKRKLSGDRMRTDEFDTTVSSVTVNDDCDEFKWPTF